MSVWGPVAVAVIGIEFAYYALAWGLAFFSKAAE